MNHEDVINKIASACAPNDDMAAQARVAVTALRHCGISPAVALQIVPTIIADERERSVNRLGVLMMVKRQMLGMVPKLRALSDALLPPPTGRLSDELKSLA